MSYRLPYPDLAFNVAAIQLPGGMGCYLTAAYLPLATCGGFAFAGVRSRAAVLAARYACALPWPKDLLPFPLFSPTRPGW